MPQAVGERRHRDAGVPGFMNANAGRSTGSLSVSLGMLMLIVDDGDLAGFAARCWARQYHRDGKGSDLPALCR